MYNFFFFFFFKQKTAYEIRPCDWSSDVCSSDLTAFEALAMGKPIVATDADGLLDILTDGEDAVIVPRRSPGALADRIVWAIDHPEERSRLAAAARVSGRRYDVGLFVRKMERLYELLHEHSRVTGRRGV